MRIYSTYDNEGTLINVRSNKLSKDFFLIPILLFCDDLTIYKLLFLKLFFLICPSPLSLSLITTNINTSTPKV